jgi:hypothetical protein
MPIAQKDLGKYRRPGIFIEEVDNSIIELPIQDVLINLVPGFSKKGPVNSPIYITNSTDFIDIFGDIDKQLERKGSYFHRTVLKMLESGPVWALNLLDVEDDRDKLQWVSVSLSTKYTNYGTNVERNIPYSKIFNRQDFWERDDESMLDYIKTLDGMYSPDRLLEMVNVGDKDITVFMFKSDVTGFDITAEEWYGGRDKVPAYMNHTDWISDWMINIVVLQGDWTNYKELSVDTTFGDYFTTSGLLKEQVENFINERTVNALGVYDVCLIPNFTDLDGRDLYITTTINQNSDKIGLFISYDEDQLRDADYPLDVIDILGNNLVGDVSENVDFMSYKQSIVETITFEETLLDAPGNVFADIETVSDYDGANIDAPNDEIDGFLGLNKKRGSARYSKWFVHDVSTGSTTAKTIYVNGVTTGTTTGQYDTIVAYSGTTQISNLEPIYFNNTFGNISKNTTYYVYNPTFLSSGTVKFKIKDTYDPDDILNPLTDLSYDGISITTLGVVSYITMNIGSNAYFTIDTNYDVKASYDATAISENIPLNPFVLAPDPVDNETETDIVYLEKGNNNILIGTEDDDYDENNIILGTITKSFLTGSTTGLTDNTMTLEYNEITVGSEYIPLGLTITSGGTDTMIIDFSNVDGETYKNWRKNNTYELIAGKLQEGAALEKFVLLNLVTGEKYQVGTNYIIDDFSIAITGLETPTDYYSGSTFITYFNDNEFIINNNANTDRIITSNLMLDDLTTSGFTGTNAAGIMGKQSTLYTNYVNGLINDGDYFFRYNDSTQLTQIYLRMYINADDLVTVDFVNTINGVSPQPITSGKWNNSTLYDSQIQVISQLGNLKQNVEMENTSQYTDLTNTRKIWIDKNRYPEVKVGSFLERYYDPNDLEIGQVPKKIVRVINTMNDANDINLKIVETDGPIKIYTDTTESSVSDYKTVQYSSIDEYVDEYKGMRIRPFKINKESIPDGTDSRISSILDVMGTTTNLGKALVDKNKISWRYLIDSFGLGVNTSAYPGGSKQQYADLCGIKKNALAFVNMPSARQFKNSNNPSFVDSDGVFDTGLLLNGGNLDLNPPYLYEFAKGVGRSTVGYFFPYVNVADTNGGTIQVPPASFVATTYMQKFLGAFASIQPWTIMAGTTNGRVTGIGGTEMDFNTDDEENLHQMGANPIVFRAGVGYVINSENTAQVFPRSSLSSIHSREVLIELENRMYDMLLRYQWRFNTADIRSEIKYRADRICKDIQTNKGLYNYRNIMDETNNTDLIISLDMGVLDTYIEIIKGMGVIVNNITILKKGAIESGGFA